MNRRKPIVALAAAAGASVVGCAASAAANAPAAAANASASPSTAQAATAAARASEASQRIPASGSAARATHAAPAWQCSIPRSMTAEQMQSFFPDPSRKPPKRDWLEFVELMWMVAHEGPFESPKAVLERLEVVVAQKLTLDLFRYVEADQAKKSAPDMVWLHDGYANLTVDVDFGDPRFVKSTAQGTSMPNVGVGLTFGLDRVGLGLWVDVPARIPINRRYMWQFLEARREPDSTRHFPPPTVHEKSVKPPSVGWRMPKYAQDLTGFGASFTRYVPDVWPAELESAGYGTDFFYSRSYPCPF